MTENVSRVQRGSSVPVINLPNALTVLRLILVPVFVVLGLSQSWIALWTAFVVFAIAAITDLGAAGIVVGLIVMGYKVMATIGTGITDLTPSRGFAAQFATATTVVIASGTGLPISTTQTLVGAVLGIGFARGIAAINLNVIRNIVVSWVVTLPAGAFFAIIIYYLLTTIFH